MGKFVALVAAIALFVVSLPLLQGIPAQVRDATALFALTSECSVPLVDGTTAAMPPDEAAVLATAAAAGRAPESPLAVDPAQVALTQPEGMQCRISRARGLPAEELTASGLTPRAATVFEEVRAVFGDIPYGGFAPGGIATGHGARSEHYAGRAIDLFFRPVGDEQQRARGWAVANWLVANAERLQVSVIIFDDRIWSARRSAQGWRPYSNPTGASDPISQHLDHVHVDVIAGG